MIKSREIVKRVINNVISKTLNVSEAAELLETSNRTVYSYLRKCKQLGYVAFIDHRHGHYRKLNSAAIQQILQCKSAYPHRSTCWIRNRLNLDVSVETVRQLIIQSKPSQDRKCLQMIDPPTNAAPKEGSTW